MLRSVSQLIRREVPISGTTWGLIALGGIALVFAGNLLRYRRTGGKGCLGHFFVAAEEMAIQEQVFNRLGIVVFAVGVVAAILV